MTGTYQFDLTLEAAATGDPTGNDPGSDYPLQKNTNSYQSSQIHSTWMQVANEDNHNTSEDHNYADTMVSGEVSMYCKHGDTIKVKVTNPNSGSTDDVEITGFNHAEGFCEPNPTSVVDPGGSNSEVTGFKDDGAIWTYVVDKDDLGWAVQYKQNNAEKASPANQVSWLFHGPPYSNGSYAYSARATFRLLSATLTAEAVGAGGGQIVAQGASVTFASSNLKGLMTSSGDKHNLYVALYNSSGTRVSTGTTGISWDSSYDELGIIKADDTSTVCTLGDDIPLGTYTAYLSHFNSSHELGGDDDDTNWNRRLASENRLSSKSINVVGTNVTWGSSDLGNDINAGSNTSYELIQNTGVILITPSSGTALVVISGNNNIKYRRRNYSLQYVDPEGGITTAGNYVGHGWDVTFYMDGPTGLDESVTGTLATGERSDSVTITTTSGGTDTKPNAFDLGVAQTDVALNSAVYSWPTTTISGIDAAAPVSVSGDGDPSVNIAGSGNFVTSGYINNNETITLRFTSSGDYDTARTATLLIGPVGDEETDSLTATTLEEPGDDDTYPDAFDSNLGADQNNVALNTTITSSTATITGIDAASTVTISGEGSPQFSINGGSYTTSGSITNNQTVVLRFTSANTNNTARTATLTIGGRTGQVTATTTGEATPHGLRVYNENGTVEIFGHTVRGFHFIATGTVTLANGATSVVAAEGMTSTNTSTIVVGFSEFYTGTTTRGTNQVTFGNSTGGTIIFTYYILRA